MQDYGSGTMNVIDLLVVGATGGTNVGESLFVAAKELGLRVQLLDIRDAMRGPWPFVKGCWHLLGHRPARLATFSRKVVATCEGTRPRWLLSTGIAPVNEPAVRALNQLGVRTLNFLTDDLWNPAHRAP